MLIADGIDIAIEILEKTPNEPVKKTLEEIKREQDERLQEELDLLFGKDKSKN